MNELRYINQVELELTPQVKYDIAFMSFPEFMNYYILKLKLKRTSELETEFYIFWEGLKMYVIKNGCNRKLHRSSYADLKLESEAKLPKQPKVKRGRGRPKKTIT